MKPYMLWLEERALELCNAIGKVNVISVAELNILIKELAEVLELIEQRKFEDD